MPELLIELFSEEIPARMQAKAADDLRQMVTNALVDAGLTYEGAQAHGGARRLTLSVEGLECQGGRRRRGAQGPARRCAPAGDRRVPEIDGPDARPAYRCRTTRRASSIVAVIRKAGRAATDVIAEIVPQIDPQVSPGPSRCAGVRASLALGAAAAFHRLHLRRRGGALRGRRHRERQCHARPPLHGRARTSRCGASRTMRRSCCKNFVIVDADGKGRDHPHRGAQPRLRARPRD